MTGMEVFLSVPSIINKSGMVAIQANVSQAKDNHADAKDSFAFFLLLYLKMLLVDQYLSKVFCSPLASHSSFIETIGTLGVN